MKFTPGQYIALGNACPELCLTWKTWPGFSSDVDASAFLPGADDKVLDDASMIFSTSRITKTPYCHALSAAVTRIAVTLVIDGSNTVRGLQQLILHCGKYRYVIAPGDRRDKALIVCHVCRHHAQWKLRAVGQGLTEDVIR